MRILLVDDDAAGAAELQDCLHGLGYEVCATVSCARSAVRSAAELAPDLALIESRLTTASTGFEIAEQITQRCDIPVVYLVDDVDESLLQRNPNPGAYGYVLKPFDKLQLQLNLVTALAMHERVGMLRGASAGAVAPRVLPDHERDLNDESTGALDELKRSPESLETLFNTDAEGVVMIGNDELQQAKGNLGSQTRLMETVFNSISEAVAVADLDGNLVFANPASRRLFGRQTRRFGHTQWDGGFGIFWPDTKTPAAPEELPLTRAMQGEPTDAVELFVRTVQNPDGRFISINGRPLRDESGTPTGGVCVTRDITDLKRAEEQLRRTIDRLEDQTQLMKTVFDSISDGVIVVDEHGRYLLYNPGAERIMGMPAQSVAIEQRTETYGIYRSDGVTMVPAEELPLTRARRGEFTDNVELFIRNNKMPDGRAISASGRPLRDQSGTIRGGVVVFRDITEIKQKESELKRTAAVLRSERQFMKTVFDSISDGVMAVDEDGRFRIINPSARRIAGITTVAIGSDRWTDEYGFFFPDGVSRMPADELPLIRAIRGQESDDVEMFVRNREVPNGVFISVSGRPLKSETGTPQGAVIVFHDVTERVRAQDALTRAFSEGRLEVMETILHNIGNAINSVSIGLGTIREQVLHNALSSQLTAVAEALKEHQDDWITYLERDPQGANVIPFLIALAHDLRVQNERLASTVRRVEGRVEHIVDIIRTQRSVEFGSMDHKDVSVAATIGDTVQLLGEALSNRGIAVRVDCSRAPQQIRVRESKFHQMLVNLIKNAIEAIDERAESELSRVVPEINIVTYVEDRFLVVDVADNGIGIDSKRLNVIFTAGYSTKRRGTGLGLHTAANFIIGSGGKIVPLSDGIGTGTTMRVMLRLSSVLPGARAADGTDRSRGESY